jgi:hypothetical protein
MEFVRWADRHTLYGIAQDSSEARVLVDFRFEDQQ